MKVIGDITMDDHRGSTFIDHKDCGTIVISYWYENSSSWYWKCLFYKKYSDRFVIDGVDDV